MRSKTNQMLYILKVQQLTQEYYEEGVTTYAGIWRKHINKVYPMEYQTYMRLINTAVPKEIKDIDTKNLN